MPAPSQLPEVGQTQESTLLQSQASTQPPPSTFPASTQSLDLTPAVERSAQPAAPAATEEIAIPVRPPKPVNPYLDRVAPPPAFSPPSLKEQLASGPRGGGRVAPRLALSGGPQGGSGEQQDGDEVGEIITAGSSRPPASSFALPLASPSSPTLPIPRNARAPALVSGGPESSPLRPSTRSLPPSASAAAASSTSLSSAPVTGGVQESTASGSHQPPPAAAKKRTATGPAKKRAPKRTRLAATPELDVVDVPEASHSIAAGANAPHLAATGEGSPPPPEATQAPPFRSAGGARAPRASRSKRSMAEGVSASEDEGPVAVEVADVTVPVGESESSHAAGSGGDDDFPDMARAIDHGVSKAAAGAAAAAEAKKAAATGAKGKAKAPAARKPRAKKGAVVTDGETTAASGTEMEAGTEVEGETEVERETEAEGRDATDVPGQKPPTKRRHRKKKPPAVGDAVEAAVESEGGVEKPKSNRRVHRKTGGKSGRPSKTIKTPPPGETGDEREDEAQEEERPFNLSTATMSELCVDPGVGRISTRFEEIQRKAADLKEARKRARLRMKQRVKTDREGGRAFDEPSEGEEDGAASGGGVGGGPAEGEAGPSKGSAAALDSLAAATRRGATDGNGGDPPGSPSGGNGGEVNEDASDDEDYGAPSDRGAGGANRFVPQMRVVNGQLILDQDSLQIDQHAEAEQEANAYEEIEERDLDRFVNQDTWRKKPRGERWGKDETELFYDVGGLSSRRPLVVS